MNDDFLTAQEAADILGYSPSWVTWLCRSRVLKAQRGEGRGRPWNISRDSVDEFESEDEGDVEPEVLEAFLDDIEAEFLEDENEDEDEDEEDDDESSDTQEEILLIASRYGPGMVKILIGVAGSFFPPAIVIYEGVRDILDARKNDEDIN